MSIVFKFFAITLCTISTFILVFYATITVITAFVTNNLDIQIFAFLLLALVLIVAFVGILFYKKSNSLKSIFIFLIFLLQCSFIKYSLLIPTVNKIINIQYCIDKGYVWDEVKNECSKNIYKYSFNSNKKQ